MRKLCLFALPFCGAVFASCCGLPQRLLLVLCPVCVGVGLLAGLWGRRTAVCLALLGAAVGLLWFQGYTAIFRAPAQALAGRSVSFSAAVTGWPRETATGGLEIEARLSLAGAPDPKILLYTSDPAAAELRPGDHISGTAVFQTADTVRGGNVTYYESRGILLRGSTVGTLTALRPVSPPVSTWPAYLSRALKESVAAIYPADVSGLMAALLTGDKTLLADGDYAALRQAGAAHIVAVSGMHLSFLAGLLAFLLRRRRRLCAAVSIPLLFLFAAVAGCSPSALRAAVMISITLLAPLTGREADPPTTLSAALLLLLAQNPYASLSVSLQLSFGAVAGIFWVTPPLYRAMARFFPAGGPAPRALLCRLGRAGAAGVAATLGALLFTTPLSAYWFNSASLIAPVSNLALLWAVTCAFVPGLPLALLGIVLPAVAGVLAVPAAWPGRYILSAARALGALPFSGVELDSVYLCLWLALVYGMLLLLCFGRSRRPVLPLCVCGGTLCLALLLTRLSLLSCPLTATMLDVGQGQCILLCSGGRTALIDCGGSGDDAGDIAADYLQSLGITRLDLLVLTHCHSDHANGVPELFRRLEVSALVLPQVEEDESEYRPQVLALAQEQGTEVTLLRDNLALSFGEAVLTLYGPLGDGGVNEEGLFALATCGEFDLLVTGDANDAVEALLVKYDDLPDIEVLVAGHHGSKTSTSDTLLDAVTPETCLISVGYNTYGHPTAEVLTRLTDRDIDIYRTDLMGNLTVRYKGD